MPALSFDSAQEYLSQINPLAEQIARDIQETKLTYGQLWHKLKHSEQNEIINETLIKPELSLRYFSNFSTSSSSSSSSSAENSQRSTPISAAQRDCGDIQTKILAKKKSSDAYMKNYYAFDGRNLKSFALQKVALKCIQDDAFCLRYRDEHSSPFSCRTKSQINLQLFDETEANTKVTALPGIKRSSSIDNDDYGDNDQICLIPIAKFNKNVTDKKSSSNGTRQSKQSKPTNDLANAKVSPLNARPGVVDVKRNPISSENLKSGEYRQNVLPFSYNGKPKIPTISDTYAVYADAYNVSDEESANLMQNCRSGGIMTAYSSSADDDDDDEEKTLCEEVKLLDSDINLRKGFDFLNNW